MTIILRSSLLILVRLKSTRFKILIEFSLWSLTIKEFLLLPFLISIVEHLVLIAYFVNILVQKWKISFEAFRTRFATLVIWILLLQMFMKSSC